jgi:hypothetical protein
VDKDPETLGQEIDLEAGKGYYTPRQAAEMLATDFFEVNRLIRQGALQAVSINRYRWIVAKSLEDMVRLKHGADRLANAPEPQLIRRQEKRVPEETGPGGRLRPMVVRTPRGRRTRHL